MEASGGLRRNSNRIVRLGLALGLAFLLASISQAVGEEPAFTPDPAQTAKGLEIFQKQVRLVLAHNCVTCHGGDDTQGKFDLTTREGLLQGGKNGPTIQPGNAEMSRLVKMIRHELDPKMPEEADKLSDQEIALITEWINLGAPYDKPLVDKEDPGSNWTARELPASAADYWAFQKLHRAEPPQVKNESWARTPIDRFVLAKLEERSIAPSGPVEKRKLIRRATFDLIGLPPTPAEVQAFLDDTSPDAYPKLIDRLLASPHYGERWGRHWLDVARFAESHGFEQDYDRPFAFHFRDFVIQAFNQDLPYDTFVRWQLAGDEIAPENPLAMMATGFLGAGVFPTQITANEVERTRYDALDDMAATVGAGMLGLTVGCARCHDHKFDPIPQADYYRMASVFTTTVRSNIDLDMNPVVYKEAKAKFDIEHAPLAAAQMKFETEQLPGRFAAWDAKRPATDVPKWLLLDTVSSKSAGGATFAKQSDGSLLATGESAANDTYTFVAHVHSRPITAVRLEALAHESLKQKGPGRADNGNFALSNFTVTAAPLDGSSAAVPVKLTSAKATFEQAGLPVAAAIDDNATSSWAVDPQFGRDHAAVFEVDGDVGFASGTVLTFTLNFNNNTRHSIARPRLSISTAARPVGLDGGMAAEVVARLLNKPSAERTAAETADLVKWYSTQDAEWQKLNQAVVEHLAKAPQPSATKVMVCSEGFTPIRHHTQGADFFPETHFLRRGNTEMKSGVATPGYLQVLMHSPEKEKHWQASPPQGWRTSYRRTGLANWITDTEYGAGSLLARVIVNRMWQHHFGTGIVATPNDFGVQGQKPTHPELLDWLATELIAGQWRLKPLHKQLMTSAVYMQDSAVDVERLAADPTGALWWRYPVRRLEAETIRDAMLAASGTLDRTMYGAGSLDEGHNRRSIYFMIKRSRLIPVLMLFDAPEPLSSIGARPSTTIAPQALLFMNNPHVRRYVRNMAGQLAPLAAKSESDAVRQGYLLALGREPSDTELAESVAFVQSQTASYQADKKPDQLTLALADLCQVLLSLNEFVYVE